MATRGSYAKGVAKRAEILDVALEVFAQEGYRGTSLRKVAHLCDLSLAGVMHYFESKEDLLVQILIKRDLRDETLEGDIEHQQNFTDVLKRNVEEPGLVALYVTMAAAAVDPLHPAATYFTERINRILQLAEDDFRKTNPAPTADDVAEVRTLTRSILAMADGLQQQWLVDRSVDVAGALGIYLKQINAAVARNVADPAAAE